MLKLQVVSLREHRWGWFEHDKLKLKCTESVIFSIYSQRPWIEGIPILVPIQQVDQVNDQAADGVVCVDQQTKEEILIKKLKNTIHQNNMNIVRKNNEIRKLQQVNHQLKLALADVVLSMQETSVKRILLVFEVCYWRWNFGRNFFQGKRGTVFYLPIEDGKRGCSKQW